MTDDRAERLRRRRNRSGRPDGDGENGSATAPDAAADGEDDAATDRESDAGGRSNGTGGSVKEERTGTYMYLPDAQLKELRRQYNVLKAEYEFEFDEEFEKNRHYYPLVVRHGLDRLEGMDVSEIRDSLEGI